MDSGDALRLVILVILLILSAYFSSAETALMSVNMIRIRGLAEEGNRRARIVQKLRDNQPKVLSAILIGNNIVNLSASSVSTILASSIAQKAGMAANAGTMVGLATGILTFLIVLFGEITPKNAAAIQAEKMALSQAPVLLTLTRILTPVIFVINKLAYGIMLLLGTRKDTSSDTMTESELLTVIDVSHEDGVIESEEKDILTNVVDFGDSVVSDVMVPRIDGVFLDADSSYEQVLDIFRQEKYSRIPVYEEDRDHIIGILNLKDLFCYRDGAENFNIRSILREPHFTYEFRKISELMQEMQKTSVNMFIVLDEYGAVSGLVTLEDLLEEIVGEIRDEYDEEETDDIQKISDSEYVADGNTRLDDINELFDLSIEPDKYDSIAGHIIHELGHIPVAGEQIRIRGITFRVERVDRNRIESIRILLPEDNNASVEKASPKAIAR